jgi:hypothetical protein
MYQLSIGLVPRKEVKSVVSEGQSHNHPNCADQCQVCKKGRTIRIMAFDAHAPPLDMLQKTDIDIKMKKAI